MNEKILFLGTRKLGYESLRYFLENNYNIVGIYSFQYEIDEGYCYDKFEKLALKYNVPIFKTEKLNLSLIKNMNPDLILSLYWKRLIPKEIIDIPKYGCLNIHNSMLPKYRGFAPINWAIINGDKNIGVTLHYIDALADTGDIIAQSSLSIEDDDTILEVQKKANEMGIDLIKKYVTKVLKGEAPRIKQDEDDAVYSYARIPEDSLIDWNQNVCDIYNFIRALQDPYPTAYSYYKGEKVEIIECEAVKKKIKYCGAVGQIIKINKGDCIFVLTKSGILKIKKIRFKDKKIICAGDYFNSIKSRLSGMKQNNQIINQS